MYDYKSNFTNALEYGYLKTKMSPVKIFVMGIMAALYVAITYVVYIQMASAFLVTNSAGEIEVSGHGWIIAALIFPAGLMMIILLGGSLFTSDTLAMLAFFDKRAKLNRIILNLTIVFIGNVFGGFLVAAITRGAGIFGPKQLMVIEYLSTHKSFLGVHGLYVIFFSAVLCNVIVAGTVWSTLATRGATGKILIVFIFIWLFTISGFQHVIANMIVFSFAWFHGDISYATMTHIGAEGETLTTPIEITRTLHQWINLNTFVNDGLSFDWTFKALLFNILPALLGNLLSGAILLPSAYWFLVRFKAEKYGTIDPEIIHDINLNTVLKENPGIGSLEAEARVDKIEEKQTALNLKDKKRKKRLWTK